MLGPLRRPSFPCSIRLLHASAQRCNLIGPPHPISHLRPIIYDDAPQPPNPTVLRHPYSLSEFLPGNISRAATYELQWKLQRQQLDDLNQNFWLDHNTRFEAAKEAVIASLPCSFTPLDKERALSEFYKQWVMQETTRTNEYTEEWRKRNISCILLEARVKFYGFTTLVSDVVTFKRTK